jgi:hypothetical protein
MMGVLRPADAGTRGSTARLGLAALLACVGLTWTAGAADAMATYGEITIKKATVGGSGGDEFSYSASADLSEYGFKLADGGYWTTEVVPNEDDGPHSDKVFTVTEDEHSGYELVDISCVRQSKYGEEADSDTVTSLEERRATIKVSYDEHVVCTFLNARKAKLVIRKSTAPADSASPKTSFDFTIAPGGGFSLTDGAEEVRYVSPGKDYAITEADPKPKGYELKDVSCDRAAAGSYEFQPLDGAGDRATRTAKVTPQAGDTISCTFTNAKLPPKPNAPRPTLSTPPAPAAQPAQQVGGVTVAAPRRPGSARLRGPSGCPTSRIVRATVTGSRIARVTFYVDGRRVKTVRRADSRGRFVLSLRLSQLRVGPHRVSARVRFVEASGTPTRTYRMSVRRCGTQSPGSAVRPQFTG